MTAIWMDGFDHYGTGSTGNASMLSGPYSNDYGTQLTAPAWGARTGNLCLQSYVFPPATYGLFYTLPTGLTHMFQSFGFSVNVLAVGNFEICRWLNNSGTTLFILNFTTTGALQLTDGSGTVLGSTAGPVLVTANWHFIEMEIDTTAHTFTVRVDDSDASKTPCLAITNSSITGTMAQIVYGYRPNDGSFSLCQRYFDDLFIRDATGTINNGWIGDRRIATLYPEGDTTTSGWTPNYYRQLGNGIMNNTATNAGLWVAVGAPQLFGSGDFTIEGFVRFQALPTGSNKAVIFGKWDETHNARSYQLFLGSTGLNGGAICWQTSTDGTNATVTQPIVYPWTPVLDTWYHIAIVRASSQDLLFINGIQQGLPINDTATYFGSSTYFSIGTQAELTGLPPVATTQLQGWFDEVRMTSGYARYTANFTPTAVEFPRGSGDPYWSDVAFLAGFDSNLHDESGYLYATDTLATTQQSVNDGPSVGKFSTVNKVSPDDNTFLEAPFLPASDILTITVNPANNNTVTVGTTNGTTPAVYTFKTALTGASYQVLIDTTLQQSLQNLYNAINNGPGIGVKYGTGTIANHDVYAVQLPAGQMQAIALTPGTTGNSIAASVSGVTGSWATSTLTGGYNIPGPTNFKMQPPPPGTTIISAVQINLRAFKSDAGVGSINSGLVGSLGGITTGTPHTLTVTPVYYSDIYQVDPDTAGPISPATLVGGAIQLNRDT